MDDAGTEPAAPAAPAATAATAATAETAASAAPAVTAATAATAETAASAAPAVTTATAATAETAASNRRSFLQVLGNTLIANVTTSYLWYALTFWVYLETRSVLATAVIGGAYMLFVAVFGIVFGVIVDRMLKKSVMLLSAGVTLVSYLAAGGIYLSTTEASLVDWRGPWFWVFTVVILIGGVVENLRNIALSTTVTLLITPEGRDRANGLVGTVQGVAFLVTSVFSGLSVGLLGMGTTLVIAIVATAAAAAHLVFVRIPERRPLSREEAETTAAAAIPAGTVEGDSASAGRLAADSQAGDPRFADSQAGDPRFADSQAGDPRFADSQAGDPRFADDAARVAASDAMSASGVPARTPVASPGGFAGVLPAVMAVPGLLALIFFTTFNNLVGGVFIALMDPYGLTLFSVEIWGLVLGFTSLGFIIGGLVVAKVGLGRNPVRTLLLVNIGIGLIGLLFAVREWAWLYVVGILLFMAIMPFAEAAEQTIIQRVVPFDRQGRVFGFAASVESASAPISAFLIGPIAEFVIIPYMDTESGAQTFGWLVGEGEARGMALVFMIASAVMLVVVAVAFASPQYRALSRSYAKLARDHTDATAAPDSIDAAAAGRARVTAAAARTDATAGRDSLDAAAAAGDSRDATVAAGRARVTAAAARTDATVMADRTEATGSADGTGTGASNTGASSTAVDADTVGAQTSTADGDVEARN